MAQKGRAAARQAVKNGRRVRRHGRKPWMDGKPVMKNGAGGTDKSHRKGRKPPAPKFDYPPPGGWR